MAKTLHTHTGTCQACGAKQAVDNTSHLIAKHGYTVDWGYFNGVCPGAGYMPAELETKLTVKIIADCKREAKQQDALAVMFAKRERSPVTFNRWNPDKEVITKGGFKTRGANETLPIADATAEELTKAHEIAQHNAERNARMARNHARDLTDMVLPRSGQPLYPVVREAKRALSAGQKFTYSNAVFTLEKPRRAGYGMQGRVCGWFVKSDTSGLRYIPNKTLHSALIVWAA